MYVDIKVTQWKRVELPECATKEQVIELLQKGNSDNGFNRLWEAFNGDENLAIDDIDDGWDKVLDPIDNYDSSTMELFANKYEVPPIWTNKTEYPDEIRLTWSAEDFESKAQEKEDIDLEDGEEYSEDFPMLYDRSKFSNALSIMKDRHDCNIGVSWDTVDYLLDEYCKI